jgi:hypothetical protein
VVPWPIASKRGTDFRELGGRQSVDLACSRKKARYPVPNSDRCGSYWLPHRSGGFIPVQVWIPKLAP